MADIEIRIIGRDEYSAQITKLKSELTALGAEQSRISGTAFNAFSRAQIGPQIAALEEMRGAIRKNIAELEVMQSTVGRGVDLRSTINSLLGLDQTIKSASASARVLGSSLASAASEDSRIRDASAAVARAVAVAPRPTRTESETDRAAREADIARSAAAFEARMAGGGRIAPIVPPREEESAERLAQRLIQVKELAASTKFNPELLNTIDSLTQRLSTLVAAGAVGGAAFEQFKSAKELETQVALEQRLAEAAVQYAATQRAIVQYIDASNAAELNRLRTANALRAAQRPASGASVAQTIESTTGIAQTEAAVASAAARGQQLANAFGGVATRVNSATGAVEEFKSATREAEAAAINFGQIWAHAVAILDGGLRGNRRQMVASFNALIRDSHLGAAAVAATGGSFAVMGAAGVAALAVVGYEAEQAYKRISSIRDTAGTLALHGMGDQTAAVAAQFDRLQATTDAYAGTVKNLQGAVSQLQPSLRGIGETLANQATAAAGLTGDDPAKILERLVKAANESPEALAKVTTSLFGLQYATNAAGQSTQQMVAEAGNLNDKYNVAAGLGNQFAAAQTKAGNEVAKAKNEIYSNVEVLGELNAAGMAGSDAAQQLGKSIDIVVNPAHALASAIADLTNAEKENIQVGYEANSVLQKRIDLINNLSSVQSVAAQYKHGDVPPEVSRLQAGQEVTLANMPLPPDRQQYYKDQEELINRDAAARREDLAAQTAAAQKRLELARQEVAEKIQLGRGTADRPLVPQADADRQVEANDKVIKSVNALEEAKAREADQTRQIHIQKLTADRDALAIGDPQRIAIQRQITAEQEAGRVAGRVSPTAVQQSEIEKSNLQRQAQLRAFQEARDIERGNIEAAHGQADAVEQIIAAYDRLYALQAKSPGVSPASQAQLRREEIRDLESEQSKRFQQINEANSGAARLGSIQVQAAKMSLEAQVAAHQISKEQMASQEATLTDQILQQQMARVQNELKLDGLTEKQQQQLHQELADLYAKDAQAQEQAQKQITAAIEAENEKRIKIFTSFFDTAGSGFEKFITEGLTRSTTLVQAETQLAKSLIGSAVSGIGSLASNYAGKALGPHLGLTEEQSTGGLGSVLGNVVAKQLGLLKDTPQDKGAQAAQLMQKAADEQSKAIDKFSTAVDAFVKGNQEINKVKAQVGSGAGGGASGDVAAQVRKYESGGNYNIGYGGTDLSNAPLNQYGFPQWAGKMGPAGISHAAGAYQFEPDTWKKYAGPLGIKDFSPASQDKVFQAAYAKEGIEPWRSNKALMEAIGSQPQTGQPTSLVSGLATPHIDEAVGDSIAEGMVRAGVGGTISPKDTSPTATNAGSAQSGRTPDEVLAWIRNQPANAFAGKNIALSTGATNTIPLSDAERTRQISIKELQDQIYALRDRGAKDISVMGVGEGVKYHDILNSQLEAAAKGSGAGFTGPLEGTPHGRWHPEDFNVTNRQAEQALPKTATSDNQLTEAQKQLLTSTQKVTETQMQQGGAIDQAVKAYNDNQSAVSSDSNALKTHAASTTETSTALGGSGTGSGASGLLGAARGAASSLGGVTPVASGVASVLGIAQSAITLFSSATSAATAATAGKSVLSAIPLVGGLFARGGIVPSAAGGMIVPPGAMAGGGQLSILHPREMVLPANISDRIQSNMGHLMPPGRSSVSNANANMTYAPQISGRFGSISSGEMRSMLRTHGDMFETFARNVVRNNGLFR